jgi:3-dehydroquinate synthetase
LAVYQPSQALEYEIDGVRSSVVIGRELDEAVVSFLERVAPHRIAVISDTTVTRLHEESLRATLGRVRGAPEVHWTAVTPGETSKTLRSLEAVLEEILPHMTRDSLIVAFGGGAVGNLAGTVASLLFRGVRFLHVPTTFMAQADSAIGIKQAVNATLAKNAFGAYHAPLAVFDDLRYLDTLPLEQWRNGVAESIKVAVARTPVFAGELKCLLPRLGALSDDEQYLLLERTIYPKLSGLADDPHERNTLLYLEIGHTIGHAIERATDGLVPHGQAIALGMLLETQVAMRLGMSTPAVYERLYGLFRLAGLPTVLPEGIETRRIIESLLRDNRRVATGPLFVFADRLGHTRTESGIDLGLVREVLEESRALVGA